MLPTKDNTKLFIRKDKPNLLLYNVSVGINRTCNTHQGYHLYKVYKVSDEEIKEGDWFIGREQIHQCKDAKMGIIATRNNKKIIATTNSSLGECQGCKTKKQVSMVYTCSCNKLPQITEEEIKEFIKNYNNETDSN